MKAGDHRLTPELVLDAVREFMPIVGDPCHNDWALTNPLCWRHDGSCPERDGLLRPWHTSVRGCVFVNFPWSDPRPWVAKAIEEHTSGRAEHVLLWGPCYTESRWARDAYAHMSAVCFWAKRVHHPIPAPLLELVNVERAEQGKKLMGEGSMWPTQLIYLGNEPLRFAGVMHKHGSVMAPMRVAS